MPISATSKIQDITSQQRLEVVNDLALMLVVKNFNVYYMIHGYVIVEVPFHGEWACKGGIKPYIKVIMIPNNMN